MFTIRFYTFEKKENSTARPPNAAASVEFSCIIRTESGIIKPTIEIDLPLTQDPSQYNYAYIPNFDRYYFVEEWNFSGRLWTATLSVDVLATYKTEIGNHDLYILRAANDYDGNIPDTLYPTKSGCDFDSVTFVSPWSKVLGMFSTGVVSKNADYGANKFYIFTDTEFSTLVAYLLSDTMLTDNGFSIDDASWELQKSLIDPAQYIKSCVYIPVSAATIRSEYTVRQPVSVFNWDVTSLGNVPIIPMGKPAMSFSRSINIPKHPQTQERGNYVNQKPYTNLTLLFPPFGLIEIDTTVTCNADTINIDVEIDMLTGLGIMTVKSNGIVLNRIEAQIGIPVQLSQVTRDYLGGATSLIGGISGSVGSFMAGDIGGGITSAVNGIGDAVRAMIPRSQSIGSGGAYAQLDAVPRLDAQFFRIVDDDIVQNGRPLCQMKTPASLGGYMLIQDGDVPTTGTMQENKQIKNYLETGFYFE